MAEKTIATQERKAPNRSEETRAQEQYAMPPVDIYETAEGLVLQADMPGVTRDSLDIRVANNLLTIQGRASHAAPGDPVYREFELANFFRQFQLTEKLDQSKISAELQHGVLRLSLPNAEEVKPRKIEVKAA